LFTRFAWCLKNSMRRLSGLRLLSGVNFSRMSCWSTLFWRTWRCAKSLFHPSKPQEGIPSCDEQSINARRCDSSCVVVLVRDQWQFQFKWQLRNVKSYMENDSVIKVG